MMIRLLTVALLLVNLVTPAFADEGAFSPDAPWTGTWTVVWRDGSANFILTQTGNTVRGDVSGYDRKIVAVARHYPAPKSGLGGAAEYLEGEWRGPLLHSKFVLTLARDGMTFTGFQYGHDWITGSRQIANADTEKLNLSSPQDALQEFVDFGNEWQAGKPAMDSVGRKTLDFDPAKPTDLDSTRYFRRLFNIVSQTTFNISDMSDIDVATGHVDMILHQAGTAATMKLTLRRKPDGLWYVVYPSNDTLEAYEQALFARSGGRPPSGDAYRQLRTPRDTMRAFLDAMEQWNRSGREQVAKMLDLSEVAEANRPDIADLVAQYIKRSLNKVGPVMLQSIPDNGAAQSAHVVFNHPAGRIEISPVRQGDQTIWQFSAATVRDADAIYRAIAEIPGQFFRSSGPAPDSLFFNARKWIATTAPSLLGYVGLGMERWQILAVALLVMVGGAAGMVLASIVAAVMVQAFGNKRLHDLGQLRLPLALSIGALVWQYFLPYLGLPIDVSRITVPAVGVILTLSILFVLWRLLDVFSYNYIHRGGTIGMDQIAFTLGLGVVRAILLIAAAANIADRLSIPYGGIVAGLGIGGLAFAFASRETLSNVFGAAILVADRPFKAGDLISAGDIRGIVENVGIRSTRLRTSDDTLLFVPNGRLADATINNWGIRRHRVVTTKLVLSNSNDPSKIQVFLLEAQAMIQAIPGVMPAKTIIGVQAFTIDGPELVLTYRLNVASLAEELDIKHRISICLFTLAAERGVLVGNQTPTVSVTD